MKLSVIGIAVASMLTMSSTALAQDAMRAGGPFWLVGKNGGIIGMIAGDLPTTTPQTPMDIWIWYFHYPPQNVSGVSIDASAHRARVDCQAGSMQRLRLELYSEAIFLEGASEVRDAETPETGTLPAVIVADFCHPDQRPDVTPYPDHRSARAFAQRHLAEAQR